MRSFEAALGNDEKEPPRRPPESHGPDSSSHKGSANSQADTQTYAHSVIVSALKHKLTKCNWKTSLKSPVRRITFSPDGLFLASFGWNTGVFVWKLSPNLDTKPELLGEFHHGTTVNDVIWCANSESPSFLTTSANHLAFWRFEACVQSYRRRFIQMILYQTTSFIRKDNCEFPEDVRCVAWVSYERGLYVAGENKIYLAVSLLLRCI